MTATLQDVTDGKGVDLAFDVGGSATLVAAIQGLAWGGRVALVGAGEIVPEDMVNLFR